MRRIFVTVLWGNKSYNATVSFSNKNVCCFLVFPFNINYKSRAVR